MPDGTTFTAQAQTSAQPARLSAWTTDDELTPDQRARFGGYVLAREEARKNAAYRCAQMERAQVALAVTGGDKSQALALMLAGAR